MAWDFSLTIRWLCVSIDAPIMSSSLRPGERLCGGTWDNHVPTGHPLSSLLHVIFCVQPKLGATIRGPGAAKDNSFVPASRSHLMPGSQPCDREPTINPQKGWNMEYHHCKMPRVGRTDGAFKVLTPATTAYLLEWVRWIHCTLLPLKLFTARIALAAPPHSQSSGSCH